MFFNFGTIIILIIVSMNLDEFSLFEWKLIFEKGKIYTSIMPLPIAAPGLICLVTLFLFQTMLEVGGVDLA